MRSQFKALRSVVPVLLVAIALQTANGQSWRVQMDRCRDVRLTQQGEVLSIETSGRDPYLVGQLINVRPSDTVLEFEYFCADGVKNFEVFLGPPFGPESRASLPPIPLAETWQTYAEEIPIEVAKLLAKQPQAMRLDMGKKPGIRVQLKGLKLRRPTQDEKDQKSAQLRAMRSKQRQASELQEYLKRKFPYQIESIEARRDTIVLSGKPLPGSADASRLRVIEHPIWASIAEPEKGIKTEVAIVSNQDGWTTQIPRQALDRDRLHSGWQLSWNERIITPRQFASNIEPLVDDFPAQRPMPANQKGMGGLTANGPLEELVELGVTGVTLNIVLSRFISSQSRPGRVAIEGVEPAVYFNDQAFDLYDRTVRWAQANNVIVSAILLVAPRKDSSAWAPLVHPESDGGRFAMPDLTTRQGTLIYGHVLDRLAKRYRSHQRAPGGITNWIAHNEIDYHHVWTNMGIQPRELVTETYYRSMRMISTITRSYNPHSRVFASLTHNWNVPDDDQGKQLSPRDLLVNLQRYSIIEGDFPWGVAYHPYPQSLFSETAWNDSKVTDDYSTPMITIQNLEVLHRFMSLPQMQDSSRQVRGILLSEQGFHTDSYNASSQANQAGSLFYAMEKIAKMPAIESFHYHRWVDHPTEGGLKMGLRTLPTEQNPFGVKKQAWHVYQAIGTATEPQATADLPGP